MNALTAAVYAGTAVAGYAAGRFRPLRRLVNWAERQLQHERLHLRLLIALPVLLAAIAALWIRHPRRTVANRRSWSAEDPLATPTPEGPVPHAHDRC